VPTPSQHGIRKLIEVLRTLGTVSHNCHLFSITFYGNATLGQLGADHIHWLTVGLGLAVLAFLLGMRLARRFLGHKPHWTWIKFVPDVRNTFFFPSDIFFLFSVFSASRIPNLV
jgi:hypothetical protein